jgi:hypothetical protein
MKRGVQDAWLTFVWINNQSMAADATTKVLPKKEITYKVHYMPTNIDRDYVRILTFKRGDSI